MFEALTENFSKIFQRLRSRGKLTEENIKEGMREVKIALLQADVSLPVINEFIKKVTEKAVGQEVIRSISPGQQIVKIVHDEMIRLMSPADPKIPFADGEPTVIMMAGLQGTGKTTTCGKLALKLRSKGRKPLLVAADIKRPAAVEQLKVLGRQLDIPVYAEDRKRVVKICKRAVDHAKKERLDTIILDTAGRLQIDKEMMEELRQVAAKVKPHQIYLVVDAMIGQDAVNSAKEFNDQLELDGVILTKMDGDARGGAALSVRAVTGKPIKFVGVGEKMDRLEEFHPERVAGRILGMGDTVTLVEKARKEITQDEAEKLQKKLARGEFHLGDFLEQMQRMKKMGPLGEIFKMIPGLGSKLKMGEEEERELVKIEAIIQSMTEQERRRPEIINLSRKRRIARGSATTTADVNGLLKQFKQMRKMIKQMKSKGFFGKMKGMKGMAMPPGFG
ncbi:MAG: signal recognition particle protein [Planctomycetota bacterium]|nr:MAG: signal recognition particle protein [Planctomycetota bacterium]